MTDAMLEAEGISVTFGGVHAVQDFSIAVPRHGRVAVIGPNGAGKSTLVRCIAGDLKPDSGQVRFHGQSVRRMSPSTRARRGIARTFQNLELFVSMSVMDNLLSALDSETRLWGSLANVGRGARRRARAREALALFGIEGYADTPTGALPYGVRKLVELSRALVTDPPLLVLDDPVAGLSDAQDFVRSLNAAIDRRECTVLLIEHDMPTVQAMCDTVHVMDLGQEIARGSYAEIASNPRVIEAYLGTQAEGGARAEPEPNSS